MLARAARMGYLGVVEALLEHPTLSVNQTCSVRGGDFPKGQEDFCPHGVREGV